MAKTKFEQILKQLSPASRKLLPQTRRVDPSTIPELAAGPCWWLLVIPDGKPPVVTSYLNRRDFVDAVRATLALELAHVFAFFGSRALLAPDDRYPQLVLPDGELVPLYDPLQLVKVSANGEVGDKKYRRLTEGLSDEEDEDGEEPGDGAASEPTSDEQMAQQMDEAYATAEDPADSLDALELP